MRKFTVKASSSVNSDENYKLALEKTIINNYELGRENAYPFMLGWVLSQIGLDESICILEDICNYKGYPMPSRNI